MAPQLRHPSKSKLVRWLETGESSKVQAHVEECERCADRLVVMDQDDAQGVDGADREERRQRIAQLLSDAFRAPDDLNERVVESVARRSSTEAELFLFAGLMAVGFDTARLVTNLAGASDQDAGTPNTRYGHGDAAEDRDPNDGHQA